MEFTITFIKIFLWGVYLTAPVLIAMCLLIILLGLIAGRIESWTKFDSIYWVFITALTVGYGDIRPVKRSSKLLSILAGGIGIMFTGIFVAITIEATADALDIYTDPEILEAIKRSVN